MVDQLKVSGGVLALCLLCQCGFAPVDTFADSGTSGAGGATGTGGGNDASNGGGEETGGGTGGDGTGGGDSSSGGGDGTGGGNTSSGGGTGGSGGKGGGAGGTGGRGGSGGGRGGGSGGSGGQVGGNAGCAADRQVFKNEFQPLNRVPDWEFRCKGSPLESGTKCAANAQAPVELRYKGGKVFLLVDEPLTGDWVRSPPDAGFKDAFFGSGGDLFCEAMGYSRRATRAYGTYIASPSGEYAVLQVNPAVTGTTNGNGFPYLKTISSIECNCSR